MYKNCSIFQISKMDAYYLSCSSVNIFCVLCGREGVMCVWREKSIESLIDFSFSSSVNYKTIITQFLGKSNNVVDILSHFRSSQIPKNSTWAWMRILQFSEGRMAALRAGDGNCHSFCTTVELMSAPKWLLNLSLGGHLFIFTWIFKQFCEQSF